MEVTGKCRTEVIHSIVDSFLSFDLDHPIRVGVSGVTASGKSTLATELAEEVAARGRHVIRASIDDFHNASAIRYRRGRDSAVGYFEDAHDYQSIREFLLMPLGPGGGLRYRAKSLDLEMDSKVSDPPKEAPVKAVLVVDGTFLFKSELVDSWDYKIFVDTTFQMAMDRGVARDCKGRPKELLEDLYRNRYHAASKMYLERVNPACIADVVVKNDSLSHPVAVFRRQLTEEANAQRA